MVLIQRSAKIPQVMQATLVQEAQIDTLNTGISEPGCMRAGRFGGWSHIEQAAKATCIQHKSCAQTARVTEIILRN